MPRVALTPMNRIENALRADVKRYKGWLAENEIPLQKIADVTGVTLRAVQIQFQKKKLSPETIKAMELMMKGEL
jgi:hypothetical protein